MHGPVRLLLFVFAAMALALPVPAAWAHAQLLTTVPAEGSVLDLAPESATLAFNEPVNPLAIRLVRPDGQQQDLTASVAGGARLLVPLPAAGQGTHVLSWRVVSADGHPIGGALVFSVGAATGTGAIVPITDPAATWALWLGKALMFAALGFGIGGAVFSAMAELPGRARTLSLALSIAGIVIAPATLGLQGLDALGLPLAGLGDLATWSAGLATSYGATVAVVTIAFAVSASALAMPPGRFAAAIGVLSGTLAALSLALSGHASAAEPQWLTRPAVFLHLGGILFWIGALPPLFFLLGERSARSDRALAGFSRYIPLAVAALLLSGLTLAFIQMGPPGPPWLAPYGIILAAKLALLIVLFGLALWNRLALTGPSLSGDSTARRRLRLAILAEVFIALAIVGLVAGWRFTPPPRALAATPEPSVTAAEPLLLHLMDDRIMAMVSVAPGAPGPVEIEIQLSDFEGMPVEAQEISVTLASPALGIEPLKAAAQPSETGWGADGLIIPLAGTWSLRLDIRLSRFDLTKLETEMDIP